MKVVVFKKNKSIISRLISSITKSDYTHAGIMINECSIIDASESRGYVDIKSYWEYKDRDCVIYDIKRTHNNDKEMKSYIGVSYDYKGVLGWLLKLDDTTKFYCFEFVAKMIRTSRNNEDDIELSLTGDSIIGLLKRFNSTKLYSGKFGDFVNEAS